MFFIQGKLGFLFIYLFLWTVFCGRTQTKALAVSDSVLTSEWSFFSLQYVVCMAV